MPAPFSPDDDMLAIIREEWRAAASSLADWTMDHLVNRKDVWGQYTLLSEREKLNTTKTYKALTLPQKNRRGSDMVTLDKLKRHFRSADARHLIGLHAAAPDNTAKWLALDIDLHDPQATDAEDQARRQFAAASTWWEELQSLGYDPLLLDSNGVGGFHLLVLFDRPVPLADVHAMGRRLVAAWKEKNIDGPPEQFPKSASLEGGKLGAWLRLFGRHHTRAHYTRVWSGDPWLDEPWLEGSAAIEAILQARPGPPPPANHPASPPPAVPVPPPGSRPSSFAASTPVKPLVCVDLDGVLARYQGWEGAERIGEPLGGALEFLRALRTFAEVVIYTTRARDGAGRERVVAWLREHDLPFDSVHEGPGKPRAHAYVDDRSVACQPQTLGPTAYLSAEQEIRRLCGTRLVETEATPEHPLAPIIAAWPRLRSDQQRRLLEAWEGVNSD